MLMRCYGICRGRGVAYVSLGFKRPCSVSDIRFSSKSEFGNHLPIAAYEQDSHDDSWANFVVVVPLLDTRCFTVEMEELDANGGYCGSAKNIL